MPRRCLIVLANPAPNSLSHALAGHAQRELQAAGHEVELLDLHEIGFEPRLSATERRADTATRETHGEATWDLVERLRAIDSLVFVFPTWWFGPPAILKGFIDRCFAPGVAFARTPNDGPIKPLLERLTEVAIITTLGSPWWVDRLVMWRPVYRVFKTVIIGGCAPKARTRYLALYGAESVQPVRFERFCAAISRCMRTI